MVPPLRASVALFLLIAATAHAQSYVPNRMIVQFSPGVVTLPAGQSDATIAATTFIPEAVRSTLQSVGATSLRMLTPTARRVSSYGAGDENQIYGTKWVPNAWVASASGNQATLETYVYRFIPFGGGEQYWWPTDPTHVYFSYTAVGPAYTGPPVVGVDAEAITFKMSAQPNPTKEQIGVELRLPSKTEGKLAVYDLGGRLVRLLASGTFDAGTHQYRWNLMDAQGRAVKAGVYFARLTSPLATHAVRLAVLR
jgi:hypothetical protein